MSGIVLVSPTTTPLNLSSKGGCVLFSMPLLVQAMASVPSFRLALPNFVHHNSECKSRNRAKIWCLAGPDSPMLSSESVVVNGAPGIEGKARIEPLINGEKKRIGSELEEEKQSVKDDEKLPVLWDDGYGTETVKDYLEISKEMIRPDGGPPRWFCPVACGQPLKDSPLLLFLPGMDGVGLGLITQQKALGKVFEVRCLHIPVYDRTPFQGLVKLVEETVRLEHASSPNKPIYLLGESFGGCLALAVASRNPTIDLVVILVNPATSFGRSQLQPLLPVLESLPDGLHLTVPYLLSFIMGDPLKMAMVNIDRTLPPSLVLEQLSANLTALLPRLSGLSDIIPKDTLLWKLKLLKSAAAYANSRLHAVKAQVLLLASGKDNMLPSGEEARRLWSSLRDCRVRYFKDNGHTLLLEDGVNLLTIIKGALRYRRTRRYDYVSDFLPPSMSEFKRAFDQQNGLFRFGVSPIMFSTLDNGKMVKGIAGVPNEGPVLLVGYHMLMGLELSFLIEEFLREKNIVVRGVGHPELFLEKRASPSDEFSFFDWTRIFGAVPVTASNLFKMFSEKSHILLYPGGAREALHRKGEEYKLFWPDQPEFVRMAAHFGATIVPFGVVGEDDIAELVLDYDDLMRIPFVNDYIRERARDAVRIRAGMSGEVANEDLFVPVLFPKIPGRFYYLFGKPITTKGRKNELKKKENAKVLYLQIKSEIERIMGYLVKKREQDPYRGVINRTIYRAISAPPGQVPTFDP